MGNKLPVLENWFKKILEFNIFKGSISLDKKVKNIILKDCYCTKNCKILEDYYTQLQHHVDYLSMKNITVAYLR